MFESHLLSMLIFAVLVSVMLACIKHDTVRDIVRSAFKNLTMMAGAVVVISWIMRVI